MSAGALAFLVKLAGVALDAIQGRELSEDDVIDAVRNAQPRKIDTSHDPAVDASVAAKPSREDADGE